VLTTLSVILSVLCLLPAAGKLIGHPRMRASASHFGIAWERYRLIGVAELAAAAGVLAGLAWRPIGVSAGFCLAALILGALYTHIRAGDSPREAAPAVVVVIVDALYLGVALTN
jgi:DoxX-like family